jgi:hypothetical protein
MSTRSRIALALSDGRFLSIYCHWDGCPAGVGAKLASYYGTTELVTALVALGDVSSLRQRLAPPEGISHTFDNPHCCTTQAYGRDRGDKGAGTLRSPEFTALLAASAQCDAEYLYVFQNEHWRVVSVPWVKGAPTPLETDLVEVEVAA